MNEDGLWVLFCFVFSYSVVDRFLLNSRLIEQRVLYNKVEAFVAYSY